MRRKPRGLTSGERQLWSDVTKDIRPLAPSAQTLHPKKQSQSELKTAGKPKSSPTATKPKGGPVFTDLPAPTTPAMDKRRFQRLVRGKLEIDATLDLHGLTADQARLRLRGFVTQAQFAGFRLLLIITGKGRSDGGRRDEFNRPRRAVIRESLPGWLSEPSLAPKVLQVTPAHPKHGGAGAFYVYLRRVR